MSNSLARRNKLTIAGIICGAMLSACSSGVKKADIPSSANPTDEINRLESGINDGYGNQFDVLSPEEFSKSRSYLDEAKKDMASGQSQREILDDVAYGQAFLEKAQMKADTRRPQVEGVLKARQAAIDSGAKNYPPTRDQIKDIDDDFRGYSSNLQKTSSEKIAKLQTSYLDLQLAAIRNANTGKAEAQINAAKKSGAKKNTPKTLKRAELDLKNAQAQIAANRDNPGTFKDAVAKSEESAEFLTAVLAASKKPGKDLDEATAITLVMQTREIGNLKGELGAADAQTGEMSRALATKEQKLKSSGALVSLQESLNRARKEFTKDEAEVFQQGDKLLLRLKSMNFPSGRSDLPAESLALLSKVKSVAEELGPKNVVVEGHTDSTGKANLNNKLSKARADAVAEYLGSSGIEEDKVQAVGYGFKKPIASNKSKAGRAQNRRVDIIITPEIEPEQQEQQQK